MKINKKYNKEFKCKLNGAKNERLEFTIIHLFKSKLNNFLHRFQSI